MQKSSKKTIMISIILIVGLITTYFVVSNLNKPKTVVGDKNINIVIVDSKEEVIYDETINTNSEILGDLLDEVNSDKETFVLDGEKESEFGRFVSAIKDVQLESNEFWVYESDNNTVCIEEVMCPGIDFLAIEDLNNFKFFVLKP